MRKTYLIFVVLLPLYLAACSGQFYKFANVEVEPTKYENLGTGSVTATGLHLFGLFPIQLNNKIERAIERIIQNKGGDELINISVQERWFWAYVLNGYKVQVSGTVLKKK